MREQPQARPLSGEILTSGAQPSRNAFAGEIVDAEYITLDPQVRPAIPSPAQPVLPRAGMEMLRRDETATVPAAVSRGGSGFWLAGLALALAAFWISGGHALVMPLVFSQAAQQALTIDAVTSRIERRGEHATLFVDGEVVNNGAATQALPPLVIAVTAGDGRVTRYILGTNGAPVAPGGRFAFSSRLVAPKDAGASVSVTFQDR